MKNLMLALVSFLLACFLAFLLFIASNQYALVKVHEFICSKPDLKHVAINKVESIFDHHNTIDAAIQPTGLNKPRNGKQSTTIAQKTTNISNDDETANQQLPQFTSALGLAQSLVNKNNHSHNQYNDYVIDKSYEGKYYYVFTFENAQRKGTYYRATVDSNNKAHVFDTSFKPIKTQEKNINLSTQEMAVIAHEYAQHQLSTQATLQDVNHTSSGATYLFIDSLNQKQLKVLVTNSGSVINLPTLK